jgi:hypothetical protein
MQAGSPPFGTLYAPKLSSADDSFNDPNFWIIRNTRDYGNGWVW